MLPTTRMLLDELDNVQHKNGYWTARCPAHDDHSNSLSISDGEKGGTVVKCHAGCNAADICQSAGLLLSQICPQQNGSLRKSKTGKLGSLIAAHKYFDEDGVLLYEACRFEKTVDGDRQKTFSQRRPNGKGGWLYSTKGVRKVPYMLPELLESDSTEPVLIPEGEKHCDKLKEIGFVATCNVGGAGKWLATYNKHFKGRDVVVLPDNDDPGRKHAKKVKKSLSGHVKSVNILELDVENEKDDVLDWFNQGNTGEELRQLVESAVEHGTEDPAEPEPDEIDRNSIEVDQEIIKALDIDVLGITEKGYIKVFSNYHKRVEEIRDIDRITVTKLLAICGPAVRFKVYEGLEDTPSGQHKLKHVKQAISVLAGFRVLNEDLELGVGVWRRYGDDQVLSWILVGAGESAVLNGELKSHAKPRFGDNILALTNSDPWYQFEDLEAAVKNYSPEFAQQVCGQLEKWFSCWKFNHQDVVPALLSGLVMATWIQTAWKWRPQVALSGQSSSGKSSLFNLLSDGHGGGIFGSLAVKSSSPTAAGLRQVIGNTSRITLSDEMESSKDRPKFFEMLRSSGSGDQILRGTASHKAQSFGLQHIAWIGSTETGLEREADLNRFIKVNLVKPATSEAGKLPEVKPESLRDFGIKALVVAMRCFDRANEILDHILETKPTKHDIRVIQSFGVPAAMYSAAMGFDDTQSVDAFCAMISIVDSEDDVISLQDDLLDTILGSTVMVDREQEMVSLAILRRERNMNSAPALANVGIRVIDNESSGSSDLFLATALVKRTILKDTEYKFKNISEILRRIKGSKKSVQRINGVCKKGVIIPLPDIAGETSEKLPDGGFGF